MLCRGLLTAARGRPKVSWLPGDLRSQMWQGQETLPQHDGVHRDNPPSMTVAVVVVPVAALALGLLGLEDAVERRGAVAGDVVAGGDAAVVGDDHTAAVLVEDVDRPALEQVAVLAE